MNRIEIVNVSKSFGDVKALDNVSLTFEDNRIYGLLGRNGAGKTTLLNIITNRLFADSGKVLINGEVAQENDRALGQVYMMSEQRCYPESMRIEDVFRWTSELHGGAFDMEYARKLSDMFSLNLRKKVKQLSTGYGSIYKIITALSLQVPFLLLDEPVLGLDANHRDMFYRIMLESYAEKPRSIIISTHLIEEVSRLIEEIIIVRSGEIIQQAPTEELLQMGYTVSGPSAAVDTYIAGKNVIGTDMIGGLKTAYVLGQADRESLPEALEITRMDLQKLFIQLTNQ